MIDRQLLFFLSECSQQNSDDTWFADGIIEGIIHILSGIENLFVIGRGTALAYADLDIDPRDVGRDLGVRYVLTGSVRRTDKRLRIATELVDALGGSLIRSDRHTGALTDLFDMQASIARDVVSVIARRSANTNSHASSECTPTT